MLKINFYQLSRVLYPLYSIPHKIWENFSKRTFKSCGWGVMLKGFSEFRGNQHLEIGNNVILNTRAFISARGGVKIGDNAHIGRNLVILTRNHNYHGSRLPYDDNSLLRPVVIEKNVWIGMNVLIVPGVTVGEGAVVAAGAVVVKDVPPLAVVGGNPAEVLKYRDRDHYQKLEKKGIYGGSCGKAIKQKAKTK